VRPRTKSLGAAWCGLVQPVKSNNSDAVYCGLLRSVLNDNGTMRQLAAPNCHFGGFLTHWSQVRVLPGVPCVDGVDTINRQDLDLKQLGVGIWCTLGILVRPGKAGASPAGRARSFEGLRRATPHQFPTFAPNSAPKVTHLMEVARRSGSPYWERLSKCAAF